MGSLAWDPRNTLLSSGSQSGSIHHHDIRDPQPVAAHQLSAHSLEVCGLRWSPTGRLLASGGNDNIVNVWDPFSGTGWGAPSQTLTEHTAAVKALAWCPWQHNILATGGGTADQHIRAWNVFTGNVESSVDTGSQVSSADLVLPACLFTLLSSSPYLTFLLPHLTFLLPTLPSSSPTLPSSSPNLTFLLPLPYLPPPPTRSVDSCGPLPTTSWSPHTASQITWWPSGATRPWPKLAAC